MKRNGPFIAYLITNTVNEKRYVGITTAGIGRRWNAHVQTAKKGGYRRGMSLLQRAIVKHGRDSFVIEHIASARSWDDLCWAETELIAQYGTYRSATGYNMTLGGEGNHGLVVTDEMKARLTVASTGRKHRPESLIKIGLAHRGKVVSTDTRAKMSAARKGKKLSPEQAKRQAAILAMPHVRAAQNKARRGRPLSADTCEKISKARMGLKPSAQTLAKLAETRSRPEYRTALSARMVGRKASPETKQRLRLSHLGKKQSAETIEKRVAHHRGKKQSPEWVAKRVAAILRVRDQKIADALNNGAQMVLAL